MRPWCTSDENAVATRDTLEALGRERIMFENETNKIERRSARESERVKKFFATEGERGRKSEKEEKKIGGEESRNF